MEVRQAGVAGLYLTSSTQTIEMKRRVVTCTENRQKIGALGPLWQAVQGQEILKILIQRVAVSAHSKAGLAK